MSQPRNRNITTWDGVNKEVDYIHRIIGNLQLGSTKSSFVLIANVGNVRSGIEPVISGTAKTVWFDKPFTTAPRIPFCFISGTDGSFGQVNIDNITITATSLTIPAKDILVSGNIFYVTFV
jgi:hypothetical protein